MLHVEPFLLCQYDANGKAIRKTFYGKTKGEAENKKKEYIKSIESGINPDLASQTLEKALLDWLWNIEKYSGNKSSTFERYESLSRNYIEDSSLGKLIVSDIKKLPIQKYYNELLDKGKTCSIISNVNKLLNKFFRYAVSEGYLLKNPISGFKLPKDNAEDIDEDFNSIQTFTDEEIKQILKPLGNVNLRYIIMFGVLTGCRLGEILSTEKSDIVGNIVRINKSVRNVKTFENKYNSH